MTTNGGGWTMVLNLEAVSDTYRWSNSFWTDTSTLNTSTFNNSTTQSKYQSFNNVAGTNLMWESKMGSTTYTVYNGAIGSTKTMYQIMQSPVNTIIGNVGINMQLNSTYYPTYGVNYYRIGPSSGNQYYSNIGWGSAQVSVQNPAAGCPQHSGGNWGINSYPCTGCNITNSMSDSCGGLQASWNSQVFIK
jgi:hypothetical protein